MSTNERFHSKLVKQFLDKKGQTAESNPWIMKVLFLLSYEYFQMEYILLQLLSIELIAKYFLHYLNYPEKWYSSEQSWKDKRLICIIDNCSSHSSGQILSKIKFSVICYIFIPVYSHQLEAVESTFSTFKWRLNRATRNNSIKLSTVNGFNSLASTLRKFTTSEIKTYFLNYTMKSTIAWL